MSNNGHLSKSEWVSQIFEQREGSLMRYATWLTGDAEQARDVVQDTFLRLCAEDPAEVQRYVVEWLFTVCRHRAVDICRKENRMKPLTELEIASQTSDEPSPAAAIEVADAANHVQHALQGLPANQQEVVRLKFQCGLSYKEISHVTNLTVTNVGFLLHSALKTLRRELRAEFGLNKTQ
ncbi:MAG: sigma-70 family RNA polymerase sigma factor [Verrucomicrobia bacterium]|nr:sigma-70 family RNA polymerase sigma factor [Verrucomicrobiota bacterium]